METANINIAFTEEEFDMILKYQKEADAVTVQAAILNAISLAFDHNDYVEKTVNRKPWEK